MAKQQLEKIALRNLDGEMYFLRASGIDINLTDLNKLVGLVTTPKSAARTACEKKLLPSSYLRHNGPYPALEEDLVIFINSQSQLANVRPDEHLYYSGKGGTWAHPVVACMYAQFLHPALGSYVASVLFPKKEVKAELYKALTELIQSQLDFWHKKGVHIDTPPPEDIEKAVGEELDLNFFRYLQFDTHKPNPSSSIIKMDGYKLSKKPSSRVIGKRKQAAKKVSEVFTKTKEAAASAGNVVNDKLHKAISVSGDINPDDVPGLSAADAANEYAEKMWKQCIRRVHMPLSTLQEAAMLEALSSLVEVQFLVGRNIQGDNSEELTFHDENSIRLTVEAFIKEFVTTNKWMR